MKTTTLKILILLTALVMSCKKTTTTPSVQQNQLQTNGQSNLDTSKVGIYKMVYCSNPSQMSSSVFLSLRYKTYHYYSATDTTDKIILYWIPNNVNTVNGNVKISNSVIYANESTNKSQPYIEEHHNDILGGFNDCSKVKINGLNYFSSDTMILNFHITPTTGSQYDMRTKYLKL